MANEFDLRSSQLKGYLREFFCKPDMNPSLWATAKACLDNPKVSFYGVKFLDDLSMQQFALAILLSSGIQFNWFHTKSFSVVQDNLDDRMLLTDYPNYDLVFITHERGTMFNKVLGQMINQVAVLRSPKKTFLFDRGGFSISDLIVPVTSVSDLTKFAAKSANFGDGDNL